MLQKILLSYTAFYTLSINYAHSVIIEELDETGKPYHVTTYTPINQSINSHGQPIQLSLDDIKSRIDINYKIIDSPANQPIKNGNPSLNVSQNKPIGHYPMSKQAESDIHGGFHIINYYNR